MSEKYKSKGKNYRARDTESAKQNKDDYFPTYHALTRLLMNEIKDTIRYNDVILEPCAGAGDISKVIKEYCDNNIFEYDINPREENILYRDFLKQEYGFFDIIITNPPFNLALEFFKKCCAHMPRDIYFLMPLDYLHGNERYETIYKDGYKKYNLKTVYVFCRRPLFSAKYRADGLIPTGATSFAWYHFSYEPANEPIIKWLSCDGIMGTPIEVEQIMMHDNKEFII